MTATNLSLKEINEQIEMDERLPLRKGLSLLRQWIAAVGEYAPYRPIVRLTNGDHLQVQLVRSSEHQLLGIWQIVRYSAGGSKLTTYKGV